MCYNIDTGSVFITLPFLHNLQMGSITQSITLHQAGKACLGHTLQLLRSIHTFQRKLNVVNTTPGPTQVVSLLFPTFSDKEKSLIKLTPGSTSLQDGAKPTGSMFLHGLTIAIYYLLLFHEKRKREGERVACRCKQIVRVCSKHSSFSQSVCEHA